MPYERSHKDFWVTKRFDRTLHVGLREPILVLRCQHSVELFKYSFIFCWSISFIIHCSVAVTMAHEIANFLKYHRVAFADNPMQITYYFITACNVRRFFWHEANRNLTNIVTWSFGPAVSWSITLEKIASLTVITDFQTSSQELPLSYL